MGDFEFQKENLKVKIFENANIMGEAAALSVVEKLNTAISDKGFANLILATGASQFQFLEHLQKQAIDIAYIGIGENGHIAFNDPPVADFNNPKLVKVVELDEPCHKQQLGEGWFPTFNDLPTHALSLTITAVMNCMHINCVVPDERKAEAVYNTLNTEI